MAKKYKDINFKYLKDSDYVDMASTNNQVDLNRAYYEIINNNCYAAADGLNQLADRVWKIERTARTTNFLVAAIAGGLFMLYKHHLKKEEELLRIINDLDGKVFSLELKLSTNK